MIENMHLSIEEDVIVDENFEVIEKDEIFSYDLYHSITGFFEMYRFEEELALVNDYIYYNNVNLNNIFKEKDENYINKENCIKNGMHFEFEGEYLMFLDEERIKVELIIKNVSKANNIILLISFLEGALKDISNYFKESTNITTEKITNNISKIDYFIKVIEQCSNTKFLLDDEFELIKKAKKIRNIVVHEWDAYYNDTSRDILINELDNFKITDLINSISKILYRCEELGVYAHVFEN